MNYLKTAFGKSKLFFTSKVLPYAKAHKIISAILIVLISTGSFYAGKAIFGANNAIAYSLARVSKGELKNTIVGTGQVSASNQIDLSAKASGKIVSVKATAGQELKAGAIIAQLDTRNISLSLQSAQLSLQKLTQPADSQTLLQAQNALDDAKQARQDADITLAKAYQDGTTAVSNSFIDLPTTISGMNDLFYGTGGYLNDSNISTMSNNAKTYRNTAGALFDVTANDYKDIQNEYRNTARTNATTSTENLILHTYSVVTKLGDALKNANLATDYIRTNLTGQSYTNATNALNNINSWISKNNSNVTSLTSAKTSIENAKTAIITADRNIKERTVALEKIQNGTDPLDIRSQQLNLQQKQLEYEDYIIRAPFDGILASLTAKVGDTPSGSIGTFITKQKVAKITLNEVDAANIKVGQPVELTFDAVEGLTATGTVASIDLVGAVSQGVVSYTTQIAFDTQDERIKPGMSVSATITTQSKPDVIMVPSAAIKTRGNTKYVLVATPSFASSRTNVNGSTTRMFNREASSTALMNNPDSATSSGSMPRRGNFAGGNNGSISLTNISLSTAPVERDVTIGDSNNTMVEILEGLTEGEFVVTKISTSTVSTKPPTTGGIFNIGGGNRSGATRAAGGAPTGGNTGFQR